MKHFVCLIKTVPKALAITNNKDLYDCYKIAHWLFNELFLYFLFYFFIKYGIICTEKAATLDFSGVAAIFVTNSLLVQCSF